MTTTVTLATNRLQQYLDGQLHSSITYIGVQRVQPLLVPLYDQTAIPPTVLSTQWYALLLMRDGRFEKVPMGLAGWSNDAAGYVQFEIDFYAAFPTGGGGGGTGTVTSVGLSTPVDGITIGGSPVTTSGTLTFDIDNTPDFRAYTESARNHGEYQAGLVVNGYDIVARSGILYWSVSTQFTTTNWVTDEAFFVAIGVDPSYVTALFATLPLRYLFTGDGGAATGTIGVNTYPMAVNVTNPSFGVYRFTAASGTPFTVGKTDVGVIVNDASNPLGHKLTQLDSTTVYIEIFDTTSGTATDPAPGYVISIETEP